MKTAKERNMCVSYNISAYISKINIILKIIRLNILKFSDCALIICK